MRSLAVAACIMVAIGPGCAVLDQYYTKSEHFAFGTAKTWQSEKSVKRAYEAALMVLDERDYGVAKKELNPESALIRAHRNERELVIDIKGEGEGAKIRLEMDQAGNDGEVFELKQQMEMLP